MRKELSRVSIAVHVTLALLIVSPAFAITGGQRDLNKHPYGALLLVPGITFCSGVLIADKVVLTAGHCTSFFEYLAAEVPEAELWVTFDSSASVDPATWEITDGIWYRAERWVTHPGYVDEEWPFTSDYGLVFLREPASGITHADLPAANLLDDWLGTGQTSLRFMDVGYGQNGVSFELKPYIRNFDFERKYSLQRYTPSVGVVGTLDPMWLMLQNVPSANFGGGCGGDSGSGIFGQYGGPLGDTVLAVHTGGYRRGYYGRLCGVMTSLNHRVDLPVVLEWIEENLTAR